MYGSAIPADLFIKKKEKNKTITLAVCKYILKCTHKFESNNLSWVLQKLEKKKQQKTEHQPHDFYK